MHKHTQTHTRREINSAGHFACTVVSMFSCTQDKKREEGSEGQGDLPKSFLPVKGRMSAQIPGLHLGVFSEIRDGSR